MSMTAEELSVLVANLEAAGWQRHQDRIVAPHGTIWLEYDSLPAFGSLRQLRETMTGRLQRILLNREIACEASSQDWQQSHDDTCSLLRCLDQLGGIKGAVAAR